MNLLITLLTLLFLFVSCTPNNLATQLASKSVQKQAIYCSPFNHKGFRGLLSMRNYTNSNYAPDETILTFHDFPEEFKQDTNSFIQLRTWNVLNSKKTLGKSPLDLQYMNYRNSSIPYEVHYINHDIIRQLGFNTDEFLSTFQFVITGTAGWQSVLIALFNENNNPVIKTHVLIPPFEMNPHTFKESHRADKALYILHPLYDLINLSDTDDISLFARKARQFCQ